MSLLALAIASIPLPPLSQDPFAPATEFVGALGPIVDSDFADLDGDGAADALIVGTGISFFRGPATASLRVRIEEFAPGPAHAAFGDIDGDGTLDVLAQSSPASGGTLWRWYSSPDGGNSFELRGGGTSTLRLGDPRIADLDGDGDGDLVAATDGNGILWFENQAGTFASSGATIDAGPLPTFSIGQTYRLLDIDGDGVTDLYVESESPIGGRRARITPGLGGGSFGSPFVPTTLRGVKAGDLDADGDVDLVGVDNGALVLIENSGGFAFSAPVTLDQSAPTLIAVAHVEDFDLDGDLDLITASAGVGPFTFSSHYYEGLPTGFATRRLVGEQFQNLVDGWADLDGDGDIDAHTLIGSTPELYVRYLAFQGGLPTAGPSETLFTDESVAWADAVVMDFDGDGDRDVVARLGTETTAVQLFESLGSGEFAEPRLVSAPVAGISQIESGDIDGDGREDLLLTVAAGNASPVLLSTPTGFVPAAAQPPPLSPQIASREVLRAQLLDADNDGDLDILRWTMRLSGRVSAWIAWNDGSAGGWSQLELPNVISVRARDLDGDGVPELVTGAGLIATGTGLLQRRAILGPETLGAPQTLVPGAGTYVIEFGDVDGDGVDDLITNERIDQLTPTTLRFVPGDGAGGFGLTSSVLVDAAIGVGQTNVAAPLLADLNADGRVDLLGVELATLGGQPAQLRVWPGAPQGGFSAPVTVASPVAGLIAASDLDEDGDIDLLSASPFNGLGRPVWRLDGQARSRAGVNVCGPANPNSTGMPARMIGFGDASPTSADLELRTVGVPPGAFGIYAVSTTVTPATPIAGSAGNLCLGGSVGRYDAPGQVLSAGSGGTFSLAIDPAAIEQPNGTVAAMPGETWTFQAWFRDSVGGAPTSNLSDALSISF